MRAGLWGLALGVLAGVLRYGRGALPTSLLIVAIVAPSCTLLGLAFALLGQRTRAAWLTRLLDVVGLLPIITPPFVLSFAMIFLLGRRGVVTFQLLGISSNGIYGILGVSLAQILAFTPVSYLLLRGSTEFPQSGFGRSRPEPGGASALCLAHHHLAAASSGFGGGVFAVDD